MDYSFRNLNLIVSQNFAPINLISEKQGDMDFDYHKAQLGIELSELWLTTMECLLGPEEDILKKKWIIAVQQQLVAISDQLNHYLFRESKVWAARPEIALIKISYISAMEMVESLLDDLASHFSNYYSPHVKITNFRLKMVLPELRHLTTELNSALKKANIDPELTSIIKNGINGQINYLPLTLSGERYLRNFAHTVCQYGNLDDESLEDLMLTMNFNLPSFHLRRVNDLEEVLKEIHGLHDQIEKIIQQKQELWLMEMQNGLLPAQASLNVEMNDYLTKKCYHLEELLAIRRTALADKAKVEDVFRMKSELPVEQMALLIRMMQVKGVIVKKEIGEVFNFFARYFYTDNALFISSRNMLKKSTEVHFSTVLKTWQLLEDWMNWLDEMFSVRNYQRKLK